MVDIFNSCGNRHCPTYGERWISLPHDLKFLLDELARMFRDLFLKRLNAFYRRDVLALTGEAGRLSHPHFRALGIPLGSGAIESSIRRVINLRLKGSGMFWRESTRNRCSRLARKYSATDGTNGFERCVSCGDHRARRVGRGSRGR